MADVTLQLSVGDSDADDDAPGRYVEGEGSDEAQIRKLCAQIESCLKRWGDDPGYEKVAHRLREASYELDFMSASPGHKEALRASVAHDASGQGPERKSEY